MAIAYTPGLKRKELSVVTEVRMLPVRGEVLAKKGDRVHPTTIVARTKVPGPAEVFNIATDLGIEAVQIGEEYTAEVKKYMLKKEGDYVNKGEIIARYRALFGLIDRFSRAPFEGTLESISDQSGQIILRRPPIPVGIDSFISGTVTEILQEEGVIIETLATIIQGIFGIGGETQGEIKMLASSPDDILTADMIGVDCTGKVVIGGSLVERDALRKAVKIGVKGVVVGGIEDKELSGFLGYSIGVAVTGRENAGLTLIMTEGFSKMRMAEKTFELLKKCEGKLACIDGSTQIRAGVIRPKIIIPFAGDKDVASISEEGRNLMKGMRPGLPVRLIQEPYFGLMGHISLLIPELQKIETESDVRILEVVLSDGRKVIVPRANVELIEE